MTSAPGSVLVDTSVLVKWFHAEGETELAEARAILAAHSAGILDAHLIDLGLYELGNVLMRALGWPADDVTAQLDDVLAIVGTPIVPGASALRLAARLAERHRLTFYDAIWAATAADLGIPLVSADRLLVGSGLAESATEFTRRVKLTPFPETGEPDSVP